MIKNLEEEGRGGGVNEIIHSISDSLTFPLSAYMNKIKMTQFKEIIFLISLLNFPTSRAIFPCARTCGDPCKDHTCHPSTTCVVDYCNTCTPTCIPREINCDDTTACPIVYSPVCANNGRSFLTSCHFEKAR